jgi:hypothetical protein
MCEQLLPDESARTHGLELHDIPAIVRGTGFNDALLSLPGSLAGVSSHRSMLCILADQSAAGRTDAGVLNTLPGSYFFFMERSLG